MLFSKINNNKRNQYSFFAIIIASMLLFVSCPTIAFAAGEATISVGTAGTVDPGKEFTVPVEITGNPGFMGASFDVKYDTTLLELKNIDGSGGILSGGLISNIAGNSAGYINMTGNNTQNGLLFNLTFKVKESASGGTKDISVNLTDNLAQNFVNYDTKPVPVIFAPGSVAVSGNPSVTNPGDDGKNQGGNNNPGNTTPPPKDNIDVKNPDPSGENVTVGKPVFIEAEEGSLSWDTNMFDGVYDRENGGYILTPKAPGTSPITYVNPDGEETSIDVVIEDSQVATAANGNNGKNVKNTILPIIIVVVGIGIAVALILFLRKARKNKKTSNI